MYTYWLRGPLTVSADTEVVDFSSTDITEGEVMPEVMGATTDTGAVLATDTIPNLTEGGAGAAGTLVDTPNGLTEIRGRFPSPCCKESSSLC
jgi:hypothetical protein